MGAKLEAQPHGGALSRGGRKPGSKNRPRPARERVARAAARKCAGAVRTLAEIMGDPEQPGAVRVMAARHLLDRGVGRPPLADPAPLEESGAMERVDLLFSTFAKSAEADREIAELRARVAELEAEGRK